MKNKIYFAFIFLLFASVNLLGQTFNCGDSLLDARDGKKYATVLIGSDCWFKQNLNYGTMVLSDSTGAPHSNVSNNSIHEKYAQYNNMANANLFGGLYDGLELMNYSNVTGGQGLCPSGWHVSTDAEWASLITNAGASMTTLTGGVGGNKLKKIGVGGGTGVGTDNAGFSALLGGDRDSYGIFYGMNVRGIFWTSTMASPTQMYHYTLWTENDTIERLTNPPSPTSFSCRCVKNTVVTGINESGLQNIIVFPNPANNYVEIILKNSGLGMPFLITNILGQTILSGTIVNDNQRIDVSSLSNGVYIIKIHTLSEKKIIITGK